MRYRRLFRSLVIVVISVLLFPMGTAYGFDPAGPPPDRTLEWTFRDVSNRTIPTVDFDKETLEDALDFLNTPEIPKTYRVEIDAEAFGEKSNRVITLKRKGKPLLDVLVEVAEQADANLVFSPGRVSLVPRRGGQKDPR